MIGKKVCQGTRVTLAGIVAIAGVIAYTDASIAGTSQAGQCYSQPAPSAPGGDGDTFSSAEGQAALDRLGSAVHEETSAIGAFLDHAESIYTVVLSNDAPSEAGTAITTVPAPFTIQLVRSCSTVEGLDRAVQSAIDGAWVNEKSGSYGVSIDVAMGKVAIDTGSSTVAEAAKAAFPDSIVRLTPDLSRASRNNDPSPHNGGAHIQHYHPDGVVSCSSGFAVVKPNGNRKMLTAGHCFGINDAVSNPQGGSFGNISDRVFPARDLEIMDGSAYTDDVYSNPGGSNQRDVTGASNPNIGTVVCQSGYVSLETCGLEVTNTSYTFCDPPPGGCTPNLVKAVSQDGSTAGRLGDSGGPVYSTPQPGDVHIRGMVVGVGGDVLLFHKVSSVEDEFNVTVLTSN